MPEDTFDGVGLVMVVALLLCVVALVRCSPQPIVPDQSSACEPACHQLELFSCAEQLDSPGGINCEQWCKHYHAVGYMKPWAECVSGAKSEENIMACGLKCE